MRKLVFEEAGRLYGKHLEAEAIARDLYKEYEAVVKRSRSTDGPSDMKAASDRYVEAVTLRGEITDELRLYEELAGRATGGGEIGSTMVRSAPDGWKPYWEDGGVRRFDDDLLSPVYINDLSP